jgi:hypothetical protein
MNSGAPKNNWKIVGAGIDRTILRFVGFADTQAHHMVIMGFYSGMDQRWSNNIEIRDLTLDANIDNAPGSSRFVNGEIEYSMRFCVGGVSLYGSHNRITRVKLIGMGSHMRKQEAFGLQLVGSNWLTGIDTDNIIDDCIVEKPGQKQMPNGISAITVSAIDNYLDGEGKPILGYPTINPLPVENPRGDGFVHGATVRNCTVDLEGAWLPFSNGIAVSGCVDGLVEGNVVRNVDHGFYQDTWRTHDLVIRKNTFENIVAGIYWNLFGSFQFLNSVTIEQNQILLDPFFRGRLTTLIT